MAGISKRRRLSPATAELCSLTKQLSEREYAVFVAALQRMGTTKGAGPMIRAMTLTVSVDGGPTVRLAYDPRHADESVPGWQHQYEIAVPCTTVSLEQQPGASARAWLKDLLSEAAAYLMVYVSEGEHWPAELRGAAPPDALAETVPPESGRDDAVQQ